jgi:hypothetical protein
MQPLIPVQLIVPPLCGQTTEAEQVAIDRGARKRFSEVGAKIAARRTSNEGETVVPGSAAAKLVAASRETETDNRNLLNESIRASWF